MKTLCVAVLLAGCAAAPLAAQIRITGLDGLSSKAKASVDITLDSSMLHMAAGFLGGDGKDKDAAKLKDLLSGLKAITVRTFEFKEDGQYRLEDLDPIRAQLRGPGWNKIISANEDGELAEIYTRTEQGKVNGFAIISAEPKELAVVAIEGSIDLSDLSKLKALGVPSIPIPQQNKNRNKKGKEE